MSDGATPTAEAALSDGIVFLLRHLGAQRERDICDSLGASLATVRDTLRDLSALGRVERHGHDGWRLVPAARAPTSNPGTR